MTVTRSSWQRFVAEVLMLVLIVPFVASLVTPKVHSSPLRTTAWKMVADSTKELSTQSNPTMRAKLRLESGRDAIIRSRTVALTRDWNVTIWEWDQMPETVNAYWNIKNDAMISSNDVLDPFGLVTWPGAVVAARELLQHKKHIQNSTVLVLGAGPGVEAQAVAMLGAKQVIATDIHPTTLQLLRHGAEKAGLDQIISDQELDILSDDPLPPCDLLVVADVMYNDHLAQDGVGRRVSEVLSLPNPPKVLVTDSQRFHGTDFVPKLNQQFESSLDHPLAWEERTLESFTGSGVLIDEDQTYDVKARILQIGM